MLGASGDVAVRRGRRDTFGQRGLRQRLVVRAAFGRVPADRIQGSLPSREDERVRCGRGPNVERTRPHRYALELWVRGQVTVLKPKDALRGTG